MNPLDLLAALKGWKTYLVAIATAFVALNGAFRWVDAETMTMLVGFLASLGITLTRREAGRAVEGVKDVQAKVARVEGVAMEAKMIAGDTAAHQSPTTSLVG